MINVREINAIAELSEVRVAWEALLARTASGTFFHTLDWLECYWRHFGDRQRLRVLIVLDDDRPIGVLPLVVRAESTRVGSLRILTYPLHDWASFFGPIGPEPAATLLAGLKHLCDTDRDWDILDLRWVNGDGNDRGLTEQAMFQAGFQPRAQKWDRTSLVEFSGDWNAYWKSRDGKFRRNIERTQRAMREQGRLELMRYRPAASNGNCDPRWDVYEQCVALAQCSWQAESDDKTSMCHAEMAGYFRDAHRAASRLGAADMNVLCLDDRPIAFAYCYHWRGAVIGLRMGFDPHVAQLSPGLVLQKMMLEESCRRGDSSFDLGTGSQDIKRHWRTSLVPSYRISHFPADILRAQLLRLNRWLRQRFKGENDFACSQVV